MPAAVQATIDRLVTAVRQFTVAQRVLAVIGVTVVVIGVVALSSWLSRPTLGPLFSGLSGPDAGAVVEELEAQGVSYELTDGGSTVMVPTDKIYSLRVALAADGLPSDSDGTGYSLLDEMPMTASDFQQETTYRRALEGELANTISAIDGVETATVRLAIPEDTVFVETKEDPTASVFVKARAGQSLSGDQVQAIGNLVSAGVDGMESTDVAVVDSTGQVLSAVGQGAAGGLAGRQTGEYEARVTQAVQGVLDQVVGRGSSAVTVTAELDFDDTERTREQYSPADDAPPLTSATTREEYTGTGAGGGGVLGPDNVQVPNGNGNGSYSNTSEDVRNAVNRVVEVTRSAPGQVERQSVAVVIDSEVAGAVDLDELEQTLAAAAGIQADRGDTIEVQDVAFDRTAADEAAAALEAADEAAAQAARDKTIRELVIAGVALLAVVIVVIVFVRRSRRSARETVDLDALPVVEEAPLMLDAPTEPLLEAAPAPLPIEPDPLERKRAEIAALADEQPQEVADHLRGWLVGAGRREDR